MLVADGEPGAEVYNLATKREQAKRVWSEAMRMVKASPALTRVVKVFRDNLNVEETFSKMEPLGSDVNTLDGLNISFGCLDEMHAVKNRLLFDLMDKRDRPRHRP